ncbi:hypothetical protein SAMD00023353_4201070 [Rosellinia necatrix]|uniref:Uncharacterized protein n=1 Tax=Rosellinia necatrix TaxID=77044 RepID=A0A1S8A9H4_ROSNE|nr:hypothetical protein SAMD00023353_4201070 [Rosellinia necatrix]
MKDAIADMKEATKSLGATEKLRRYQYMEPGTDSRGGMNVVLLEKKVSHTADELKQAEQKGIKTPRAVNAALTKLRELLGVKGIVSLDDGRLDAAFGNAIDTATDDVLGLFLSHEESANIGLIYPFYIPIHTTD